MSLFGQNKRHSLSSSNKGRRSPLPISKSDTLNDKYMRGRSASISSPLAVSTASGWFTVVHLPLPRIFGRGDVNSPDFRYPHPSYSSSTPSTRRRVRVYLPIPPAVYRRLPSVPRPFGNPVRTCIALFLLGVVIIFLTGTRKNKGGKTSWTPPFLEPGTLVLTDEEVARIWEWELLSGHHPSVNKTSELPWVRCWELRVSR
jgi:WD repeat and SOF domain-containing protein 1